jgi:hypothetical protein
MPALAGVGRYGMNGQPMPGEVVMASAQPKPDFVRRMERTGIEPVTSGLQSRRSPS